MADLFSRARGRERQVLLSTQGEKIVQVVTQCSDAASAMGCQRGTDETARDGVAGCTIGTQEIPLLGGGLMRVKEACASSLSNYIPALVP